MLAFAFLFYTHIFQYDRPDDMSVETRSPSVQPDARPVSTGAEAPVSEVPNLQGHSWTNAVDVVQPRHLAVPLRRQELAVERDIEERQLRDGVQEH